MTKPDYSMCIYLANEYIAMCAEQVRLHRAIGNPSGVERYQRKIEEVQRLLRHIDNTVPDSVVVQGVDIE